MGEAAVIETFLAERRRIVEAALERALPGISLEPVRLHRAMRHAMLSGGKRMRPACVLLGAIATGGREDKALPGACAVEMVHTYSLIHDDLPCMDDDDLRRGRPTVHRAFDVATAVLAGDALLTLAFQTIAGALEGEIARRVTATLAEAAGTAGMVGGQIADLEAEGKQIDADQIVSIDRRKTAAIFAASFAIGGICAGADELNVARLHDVGNNIGIAFQIVDDLLDIRATPQQLGKATGKDRVRGKATLPDLLGEEQAFREAQRFTDAARELSRQLPAGQLIEDLLRLMLRRSH